VSSEKTSRLELQTPEGITFSLLLASPITRFLAWLIDTACISTLVTGAQILITLLSLVSADAAIAVMIWAYFLISTGYSILCEWGWRGQTLGKRLLKLRVVDEQGLKLHFSQVLIRNLLRTVDMLPGFYMVGGLSCLFSHKAQRVGDLLARTVVIRHPLVMEPDFQQLMAGKYNSFRKYPHLCARLRQHVSPREAAVALQALMRRNSLIPEARVKVFEEIAGYLKNIVPFPEEATEGLSNEQYLRNAADVLYNSSPAKESSLKGADQKTEMSQPVKTL
jgi:uncharacterized RDD family membrane protein YckC